MHPTLHDIARRMGISHMTVSRALGGGPASPRTRERVRRVAASLGYRPNAAARAIVSGRFNCVALLLGRVVGHSHLPEDLLFGVHDALAAAGLQLKLARLPDDILADRQAFPSVLKEWSCDGLLVDYTHDIPPAMAETIETCGLPAIWINALRETDCVRPDDEGMGRLATEHLLALGHRRICYLDCCHAAATLAGAHYSARHREAGYRAAMEKAGLPPRVFRPARSSGAAAQAATVRRMLAAAPAAVVCYSIPAELERRCIEQGLAVPEAFSLVTFGEMPGLFLGRPPACVPVPARAVAREAVAALLRKIRAPETTHLPSVSVPSAGVVAGGSVRPAKPPPPPGGAENRQRRRDSKNKGEEK
jgi:LacI family transcriptional regulator